MVESHIVISLGREIEDPNPGVFNEVGFWLRISLV